MFLNRRVLWHKPPHGLKPERDSFWEASKERADLTMRWLLRSIPKSDTKQITQKKASTLLRFE